MKILVCALLLFSFQREGPEVPGTKHEGTHWYEQVSGVIAIRAGLIGLAYAYLLLRKTRLESQKLEYEIGEKTRSALSTEKPEVVAEASHPTIEAVTQTLINQRYSVLLLRYVVMELTLRIYKGLTTPISWLSGFAATGVTYALKGVDAHLSRFIVAATLMSVTNLSSIVVDIGYWCLFIVLGWPLFKDANSALGIQLSEYSPHVRASTRQSERRIGHCLCN